jgi:UPF0271 protein
MFIDLNSDLGESFGPYTLGHDETLIPLVTSVNVACGWHAGDPNVMARTVQLAARAGVAIGAHPGYADLQGFGRRAMTMSSDEIENLVLYQLGALAAFTRAAHAQLTHIKPHGALYNQAARDPALARAIAQATRRFDPALILVGLAGSALMDAGVELGLRVAGEGFPDRGYAPDGQLLPRNVPGAARTDPAEVAAQAVALAQRGISARAQTWRVDTLCLHGDNPNAPALAQAIRAMLQQNGIALKSLG